MTNPGARRAFVHGMGAAIATIFGRKSVPGATRVVLTALLAPVAGIGKFPGDERAKEMLARQGFVVLPEPHR